jgi:hypothetical protein
VPGHRGIRGRLRIRQSGLDRAAWSRRRIQRIPADDREVPSPHTREPTGHRRGLSGPRLEDGESNNRGPPTRACNFRGITAEWWGKNAGTKEDSSVICVTGRKKGRGPRIERTPRAGSWKKDHASWGA